MTNKINKYRGIIEFEVNSEKVLLGGVTVNDLFDLLILNNTKEHSFVDGVKLFTNFFIKSYPSENVSDIESFVSSKYSELFKEFIISIGWTTREEAEKSLKSKFNKDKKEKDINLFKATLAADADTQDIEESYITACYVLMREFKYTRDEILNMDASVFLIILDEMKKQGDRENQEMKDAKNKRLRN